MACLLTLALLGQAELSTTAAPTSINVNALAYYRGAGGKNMGQMNRVGIKVGEASNDPFRVGFYESEVKGSGEMWRASGWMASVVATQVLGYDSRAMRVSFDISGHADGPSAGGLLTCGVIAATRGDRVRPDAAMTGTINPDGTIGPVGGIVHKIEGAAAGGVKLVIIPAGIRRQVDLNSGQEVDLIAHGKSLGVEVHPALDIHAAYAALTGVNLPRSPVAPLPPIDAKIDELTATQARRRLARMETVLAQWKSVNDDLKSERAEECAENAKDWRQQAERRLREGDAIAAYANSVDGFLNAVYCSANAKANDLLERLERDDAKKQLKDVIGAWREVDALGETLKSTEARSIGQAGLLMASYGLLAEATALCLQADHRLTRPAKDDEEADENVRDSASDYQAAIVSCELARDNLEYLPLATDGKKPADALFGPLADFFERAAIANLNAFDQVIVEEAIAKKLGLRLDAARSGLMSKDHAYAIARLYIDAVVPTMERFLGKGQALAYAKLGATVNAYTLAAGLIAKYYSLDAELDEDLEVTGIGRETTLAQMLDQADEQVRRDLGVLHKGGVDTSLVAYEYRVAKLLRDKDASDKIDALSGYWSAHVYAQMMIHLGRLSR